MGRTVLVQVLLFLAPFAAYALALTIIKRDAREPKHWSFRTLTTLASAGVALMIVGFVVLAQFGGAPTTGVYEPARYEDGKLIPGRIK